MLLNILFCGKDNRLLYAYKFLIEKKYKVKMIDDKEIEGEGIYDADIIVFPFPTKKQDILKTVIKNSKNKSIVLCNNADKEIIELCKTKTIRIINYLDIETFLTSNALLSAEGAVFYAKEKYKSIIHGSQVAVLGFGRIGKILSYLLQAQGAHTTVYARKELDVFWSTVLGINSIRINNMISWTDIQGYDVVFNTIPDRIINVGVDNSTNEYPIIIDVASSPYGIGEEIAKKYNLNYHIESNIPSRYAPQTAGIILGNLIIKILEEENIF